jgi:hypothetical protein
MNSPLLLPVIAAAVAVSAAFHCQAEVSYSTILDLNQSVTGVRGYDSTTVILTGSVQSSGATVGMWWQGSLDTGIGTIYAPVPTFSGQTVTTSIFYGPNTALFDPGLGAGNIRVAGSYQYSESSVLNHGFLYTGPVSGTGGTWTQIDVPGSAVGGATVENTIPHSNMGDFVVGNYDLQGMPASGNAFLYKISDASWTIFDFGGTANLTSAYGIWQNGADSYTIAGGSQHLGVNKAFLADYTPSTGLFTSLTFFEYDGAPGVTHFEGITAVEGGYNVIATTDSGAAFAFIPRNVGGTFGEAVWTAIAYPGSGLTTGDTVYQNVAMGIYFVSGGVRSYTAVVLPDQYGVAVSVAKSGSRATFTITNTGNTADNFSLSRITKVANSYTGPSSGKPGKSPLKITYSLGGANITKALEAGTATTGSLAAGGSVDLVEKVKAVRRIAFKRTIHTTIQAVSETDPSQSASAEVKLVVKPE